MKNLLERTLALIFIIFLSPFLGTLYFLIKINSKGPALYWSERVGKKNISFFMPKFRTMIIDTPEVATHLLQEPDKFVTSLGRFLRKTSLDEIPQLYSILMGDMSFVGPRPALLNQVDLIELRKEHKIDRVLPGVTGWAQVNGRDELSIEAKVKFEQEYLKRRSLFFDSYIIWLTLAKVFKREHVSH